MADPASVHSPKIFLSHSWADKALVRRLEAELEAAGAEVWVDHAEVRLGDDLPKEISDALTWCDTLLLVWSKDAAESHWVEAEWTCAFSLRKLIIPCRVDKTDLPALLANLLYLDLKNVDQGVAQLREAVVRARKPVSSTPATPAEKLARFLRFQTSGELPAVWNITSHRNPNFTGREELLTDLRAALIKEKTAALTQPQAIHGLGGVGKTQLALEYAYRFAAEFQIVWWLRSEEPVTLAADYAALATALDLPEKIEPDQTKIVQAVRQWLDHHTGWLLIFDNAQQAEDLLAYLPQSAGGQVIITSRNPQWQRVAQPLKVQVWPREEAIEFLLRRSRDKDEKAADSVAEALGDLPLALEQAAAYVEATGTSLAGYLDLFGQYRAEVLKEHRPLEYPDTVATTWEMAFQKLKKEEQVAVELLNALAFLAPDDIPRSLLIEHREHLPESLAQALAQPLVVNKAVAGLVRYSLVEATAETLSLHRLVQAVTRDRMPAGLKKTWALAVARLMAKAFPFDSHDVRYWPERETLLAHALAVAEHAEKYGVALEQVAKLCNQAGLYQHSRAQYAAAEPLYRRALGIDEKAYGPNHPSVATDLNNLAWLLYVKGDYAAAEPLYRRALGIREKQLGPEHSDVAPSLNNLALFLFHVKGDYAAAEPLYRRALGISEKQLGPEHPEVAQSLNNLARLLHAKGDYAAAEPLYRRALEISEKQLGPEHPYVAASLNHLAGLLKAEGDYAAAETLFRRVLEISEKQLGQEHPDVALILNSLAGLQGSRGDYAAAESLYHQALKIWEKQLGLEHPYVATGLNNLAQLLRAKGDYAAAETLHRRALGIWEKQLGPEHPDVAQSLNNLAGLLYAQGEYAAAEPLYRRAIAILEKTLGPEHPNTRTVRKNYELLLQAMK